MNRAGVIFWAFISILLGTIICITMFIHMFTKEPRPTYVKYEDWEKGKDFSNRNFIRGIIND